MASGNSPGTPDRIPSDRTDAEDEKQIPHRAASKLRRSEEIEDDLRYFTYQHIGVLKSLSDGSKAVCQIKVKKMVENGGATSKLAVGTCFLGKFDIPTPQRPTFGLFTAYHVLGEKEIRDRAQYRFTITNRGLPLNSVRPELLLPIGSTTFCFTCPLLDVTFIEFDQHLIDDVVKEKNLDFLHMYTGWNGKVGEMFHVLHYPRGSDQYFSTGHLETYYGLHLFHSASTEDGSSGAPIMIADEEHCRVVAIHTAQSKSCSENYNVAVATESVFNALKPALEASHNVRSHSGAHDVQVSHHPTQKEMKGLKNEIHRKGLKLDLKNREEPARIPSYFVHPGVRVTGVQETVKIYFVLTSHGWYWSAIAPDNPEREPNWVSATATHKVFGRGSEYEGKTVVEEQHNGFTFEKLQSIQLRVDSQSTDSLSSGFKEHASIK